MIDKQRSQHKRLRSIAHLTRQQRRGPVNLQIATARATAEDFVATRWPMLIGVRPEVSVQEAHPPLPELLARLGLDSSSIVLRHSSGQEYTFTFAGHCDTADGAVAPLVAAITVDSHQRIVKTSLSK